MGAAVALLMLSLAGHGASASVQRYGEGNGLHGTAGQLRLVDLQRMTAFQQDFMSRAAAATAIILPTASMSPAVGGSHVRTMRSLSCPNEFAERETRKAANGGCSAILVSRDVLLTAAHCVLDMAVRDGVMDLGRIRAVFRFEAPEGQRLAFVQQKHLREIEDVLWCEESSTSDLAVIRLAAPAAEDIEPVPLSTNAPAAGDPVHLFSFPRATPLRIATCLGKQPGCEQATITEVHPTWFRAPLDSYDGSSGGAVLDRFGRIVGVFHGGAASHTGLQGRTCSADCVYSAKCKGDPVSRIDTGIASLLASDPMPVKECRRTGRMPWGPACPDSPLTATPDAVCKGGVVDGLAF